MKFAPLLAQYLYTHKRLDLPGIGSFLLDPSAVIETENSKQNKPTMLEGVSFENNVAVKQSVDLVDFISSQSGKIKPLAAADLDSHLELAKQFLNIGKPFMFEGIGSLSKVQAGGFFFTPGELIAERVKDVATKIVSGSSTEEPATDYRSVFHAKKAPLNWRKPVALLLLLAGIVVAIWGGYMMYKKNTRQKNSVAPENNNKEQTVLGDTTANAKKDTLAVTNIQATTTSVRNNGTYKFILETSPADRALNRYSRLKSFQWPVQLETKDSITYQIFIQSAAADTSRFIDSLSQLNGRRVYIEQ